MNYYTRKQIQKICNEFGDINVEQELSKTNKGDELSFREVQYFLGFDITIQEINDILR